jgi:hypothetical protein
MKCLNCEKRAFFGEIGGKPKYCKSHKLPHHVDVKHKTCQHPNCSTQPVYGEVGSKIAQFCVMHKLSHHVDVKNKTCQHPNCSTQPVYGEVGSKIAQFCVMHKPPNFVNVISKTCQHPNCSTRPTYGEVGSKIAQFCAMHKLSHHVNVKDKTCQHPNCSTRPNYGEVGSKVAQFCTMHKPPNFVNVKSKTCQHPNCSTLPAYGEVGSKIAQFCALHKLPNFVDVKNKTCQHPNCSTRANYGKPCYLPTHCAKHKYPDMIYNPIKNGDPDKMIVCNICYHKVHYSKDICDHCQKFIERGNVTEKQLRKEIIVKNMLESNGWSFQHDVIIDSSCSKRRPDFLFTIGCNIIILEVDEHQHKSNLISCEIIRMRQIYQDIGILNAKVLFVRYNPDSFKGKQKSFKQLDHLELYLKTILNADFQIPFHLSVVYLCYDGYDTTTIPTIHEVDIERTNSCELCDAVFINSSQLFQHIRNH